MFYSFYYIAPLVIKNIILLFCCTPNPFFPLTSTLLLLLLLLFCTHRERERALNHTQKKKKGVAFPLPKSHPTCTRRSNRSRPPSRKLEEQVWIPPWTTKLSKKYKFPFFSSFHMYCSIAQKHNMEYCFKN
jgi:hypothetical protein